MTLLAIVFITLKLTGNITWPWLWVLAPIWAPLLLAGIIVYILVIIADLKDEY
ncbi:hypothetical protein [Fenollaria massiliensis]|jgi:hypothetical protein|uniref:hypothetical protein n=1 Tax=Fenollaria massiliensis TaxID=938288 RepID=UPI000381EC86|nr:hypothetical protein [Fenollaria massiliensis]